MSSESGAAFMAQGDATELYGTPGMPFVPAIRIPSGGDLVFVSGCLGLPIPGDTERDVRSEVRRGFRALSRSLAYARATLDDVVSVTKFLVDLDRDNAIVAEETRVHLPRLPTSTTVEVVRLVPPDMHFEICAVAVVRNRP
jgi:2-iminobutanoate/2-iminopropanoate deaminase